MRGPKWDTVIKNYFYARKKLRFMVRASFVKNDLNIDELDDFKKMFGRVEICEHANWTGARHSKFDRKGRRVPCWVLMHQMFVLWDGKVVPCCMDFDSKQILGDANKQHLRDIWNDSNWMRDKHRNYDFDIPVCKDCNYNTEVK
jgi:radical SAM protein with 4Fe4S-binding SPASM domain